MLQQHGPASASLSWQGIQLENLSFIWLLSIIVNLLLTPAVHVLSMAALFGCDYTGCMVIYKKAAVKLQKLWLLSVHEMYIATVQLQCIWSCFVATPAPPVPLACTVR